jgi:hypothetical protein
MGASGWDYLMLQAGADYHGSALFGVGPLLILGFGQYDTASASQGSNSGSSSIQNTALHEWLAIGLRGTFDFSEAPREDAEGSTAPASAASSRSDDQKAENDDARLLDQLQALCTDGRADACTALQFATAKRGCCTWHRGARKCDDQGQVVCMDGQISATCTCSAADLVSTSGASSPAVVSPAASSTVDSDRPLLQRLDTLCADAKAGACEALQFATQKRACCSAHQGARKCDADGHVVCMDGEVNASCSCSAANSATPPVAPTVPVDGKACKPPFTVDSVGHKHAKPGCGAAGQ